MSVTTTAKEEEIKAELFLQNNINSKKKKWYCSSSSWARTPCNGFSTQNSKGKSAYLFYNFV